jgi:hypothetical protein
MNKRNMELIISEAEPQRIDILNETYIYKQKNGLWNSPHAEFRKGVMFGIQPRRPKVD